MTESHRKQGKKNFSTQTVRVPLELEKPIGHRLVESGESFQALVMRLIRAELEQPSESVLKVPEPNQSEHDKELPKGIELIKCPNQFKRFAEKLIRILKTRQDRAIKPLLENLDAFDLLASMLTGTRGNVYDSETSAAPREDQQGSMEEARSVEEAIRPRLEASEPTPEETDETGKSVAKRKRGNRGGPPGRGGD